MNLGELRAKRISLHNCTTYLVSIINDHQYFEISYFGKYSHSQRNRQTNSFVERQGNPIEEQRVRKYEREKYILLNYYLERTNIALAVRNSSNSHQ